MIRYNRLLHEIVLRQAEKSPGAVAVIDQDKQFTYSEISEMAKTTAARLQAMSVEPGDVVAIVLEKGWEQVVAALGILMTGASYLPLNPSHPDDRLKSILSIAGCKTALTHGATETGSKRGGWRPERDPYGPADDPASVSAAPGECGSHQPVHESALPRAAASRRGERPWHR